MKYAIIFFFFIVLLNAGTVSFAQTSNTKTTNTGVHATVVAGTGEDSAKDENSGRVSSQVRKNGGTIRIKSLRPTPGKSSR